MSSPQLQIDLGNLSGDKDPDTRLQDANEFDTFGQFTPAVQGVAADIPGRQAGEELIDAIRNPVGDTIGADVFETDRSEQQRRLDPSAERFDIQIQSAGSSNTGLLDQLLGPIGAAGALIFALFLGLLWAATGGDG